MGAAAAERGWLGAAVAGRRAADSADRLGRLLVEAFMQARVTEHEVAKMWAHGNIILPDCFYK